MKFLLAAARASSLKAGVEIFSSHLKKVFPDLEIMDYHTLLEEGKERKTRNSLFREPINSKRLALRLLGECRSRRPEVIFTNGMHG